MDNSGSPDDPEADDDENAPTHAKNAGRMRTSDLTSSNTPPVMFCVAVVPTTYIRNCSRTWLTSVLTCGSIARMWKMGKTIMTTGKRRIVTKKPVAKAWRTQKNLDNHVQDGGKGERDSVKVVSNLRCRQSCIPPTQKKSLEGNFFFEA